MRRFIYILASVLAAVGNLPELYAADPSPSSIQCPDVRTLRQALDAARRSPNTVIELLPQEYRISRALIIQGDGTVIHGNGATLFTTAVHTGVPEPLTSLDDQGTAMSITPLLGRDEPFEKSQTNGLWRNPHGFCEKLNKAIGGSPQHFGEAAPDQDADGKTTAEYTLFAPYRIVARNIRIDNLKIRFGSKSCDSAFSVTYAKNVLLTNITILNQPKDMGGINNGDLWVNGSEDVTLDHCAGPAYIEMNSSNRCVVKNCNVGGVTFEEMARWCAVQDCTLINCRVNDLLCTDIIFDRNIFTGTGENVGALWGGTRIQFTNNTCAGAVWLGGTDTRGCIVKGNKGTIFSDYAKPSAGNSLEGNIPQK